MTNTIRTKRGLEANRTSVTPAEGELIYTTDQKKLYVGDGTTAGGVAVGSTSGERDFVAEFAIAAGKPVALNYNGKIEEVFSINQANATGTPATMTTTGAAAEASFTVYDDVNDKIVWLYRNSSGFPVVVVGTVGSLTVTWGTPVVVASISCITYTIAYVGNGKVVVSFSLSSNDDGVAYVGTVSGNSISFGAQATFSTGQVQFLSSAYDKANDRVAVVYRDGGNNYGRLVVGQVSGTSITFGTPAIYSGTTVIANSSVVYDDAAGKIVIFADAGASAADVRYCVATISGNSATFGTLTSIVVSAVQAFSYAAYDTKNKKYLVAYRTATTTFSGKFGTYSGGTITWGDTGVIDNVSANPTPPSIAVDPYSDMFVYTARNGGGGGATFVRLSALPSVPSALTNTQFDNASGGTITQPSVAFDTSSRQSVVCYYNTNPAGLRYTAFRNYTNFTNSIDFIGFAKSAISAGATGTVTIQGGTSTNQTGLVAGSIYYVNSSGTLTTTETPVVAGFGLSATSLWVNDAAGPTTTALVPIASSTVTGTPSAIEFTNLPQYDAYIIDISNLISSTFSALFVQFYLNGTLNTANYAYGGITHNTASAIILYSSSATEISFGTDSVMTDPTSGRINIFNGAQSAKPVDMTAHIKRSLNPLTTLLSGTCKNPSLQTFDGIRFTLNTGTFTSGNIKVYGVL